MVKAETRCDMVKPHEKIVMTHGFVELATLASVTKVLGRMQKSARGILKNTRNISSFQLHLPSSNPPIQPQPNPCWLRFPPIFSRRLDPRNGLVGWRRDPPDFPSWPSPRGAPPGRTSARCYRPDSRRPEAPWSRGSGGGH